LTRPHLPPRPGAHVAPAPAVRLEGVSAAGNGAGGPGITLALRPGEFVAVTGLPGAGKSALLRLIAGLERPASGTVSVAGVAVGALRGAAVARFRFAHLGIALPDMPLVDALDLRENVALPLLLAGAPRGVALERAAEVLRLAGVTGAAQTLAPEEATAGARQLARVARACVTSAQVLLLDEPTEGLEPAAAEGVLRWLRRLASVEGRTVVVATSRVAVAAHADREVRLRSGALEAA